MGDMKDYNGSVGLYQKQMLECIAYALNQTYPQKGTG